MTGQQTFFGEEKELRDAKLADELAAWWVAVAGEEIDQTVEKAIEYSAVDLEIVGYGLLAGMGVPEEVRTRSLCSQAGVAFYIQGKVGRMLGALAKGEEPSADTWLDTGVYARMGQRIQEVGGWPS